jgi:phospholipid transport system transporter-binding protein
MPLPERLTIEVAAKAMNDLARALEGRDGTVCLDASSMREYDSSAVAVLLELRRYMLARGRDMQVLHWPSKLAALVRLYGVGVLLGVEEVAASPHS